MSAADLKAQGNALFEAKNFAEAEKKYTKAIEASDEVADCRGLAVLYANRAACRLSLKRYMDADADAKKATHLDPTYAKAYARLATAKDWLGNYPESTENWKRALDALPKTNLKPAEEVQKAQYEAGLKVATAALTNAKNRVIGEGAPDKGPFIIRDAKGRMPWDLAAAIIPRLKIQRPTPSSPELYSSAWVIHGAYKDFMSGVSLMSHVYILDPISGKRAGMLGAVAELTNGIMRDSRVMHFPDGDFITKYNNQVAFEGKAYEAWTEGGPEVVIQAALEKQRKEGWKPTRQALSLTVRAWIMRGKMDSGLRQNHHVAVEFYKNCLHVIRTLREHWILESKEDRGVIFEKTFLFGVQQLYIDAIMQTYSTSDGAPELLEDLLKESDLLIREIDEALHQPRSQDPVDPGFLSSFYMYPKGQAYAMRGFYFNKMAMKSTTESVAFPLFRKAALEYLTAAKSYPEDDELHPYFLNVALGNMLNSCSFSTRETLDVMKRIRIAVPKAKEIWEHSALGATGVWKTFDNVAKQEQELRDMVAEGKYPLDTCLKMQ
ncbi:TPR-like protein [Mycena venus]|uniref:TPR-like protein n=1 Tax=Mycena venus TaxID=2733690 RepID=A0A8H6XAD8_9AGAR|nr:TPR-like protein [Mycena venus]